MAIDNSFDRLYAYRNFNYWTEEAIFERRFMTRGYSYSFINWHCVDVNDVTLLIRTGLSVPVRDQWPTDECLQLLFVPTTTVPANYSSSVTQFLASELNFSSAMVGLFVCVLVSFFGSALVGRRVDLRSDFIGYENIAVQVVLLPLHEVVQTFCRICQNFPVLVLLHCQSRKDHSCPQMVA